MRDVGRGEKEEAILTEARTGSGGRGRGRLIR